MVCRERLKKGQKSKRHYLPLNSLQILPLSLILPVEPKEQEAGVESMGATATKTRKLPPGIAPPEMKQLSKSFEILSNSGPQNPGLVKLNLELNMQA